LSPVKIRKILIGGTNKMIVFDDMEPSEKVKIYDKGINVTKPEEIHKLLVKYRSGDIVAPNISQTEALKLEIEEFIDQVLSNTSDSINDLVSGQHVVEVLEASTKSLKEMRKIIL